jgi:hypothetical protein
MVTQKSIFVTIFTPLYPPPNKKGANAHRAGFSPPRRIGGIAPCLHPIPPPFLLGGGYKGANAHRAGFSPWGIALTLLG